jgi:hypothetical protein
VFNRIFAELAGKAGEPDRIMIDATHLKAHRTAASLLKGGSSQTYRALFRSSGTSIPRRVLLMSLPSLIGQESLDCFEVILLEFRMRRHA